MTVRRIRLRRDTASAWTSANPTLALGEIAWESDTSKIKIGDGTTAWTSLAYYNASLNSIGDVTITDVANGDFLRWNGSAWINDAVNLSTDTVGDFVQSLVAGTGVTVSNNSGEAATPTIQIGQAVGTTDNVTFNTVTADLTGDVTGNADTATTLETARTISLGGDLSGSASFDGSADITITATISADSTVLGTDTTGDYVESLVAGTGVTLTNNTGEGATPTVAIGQAVETTSDVTFNTVTADLTGNADTATTLETARTISLGGDLSGSASFDGSSDVTITATIGADSVALGTDTTGNYVSDVTGGTGVTVTHTPGEGSSPSVAIGQAVGTADDVTFNTVTADLTGDVTGNADTATTLETARTISLGGDLSGSASFNGSADVTITATIGADSVALGTDTTGDYVGSLVAGTGVTLSNNSGEGATPTVAIGQSVGTSDSPTFAGATLDAVQVGITAAGEIDTASGNLTIDSAGGTVTVDDNLVVTGDLTVSGTTTTVNTETINLADNIITLNSNETGTPSQNAGLEVERGTSANVELRWNETSDKWELTEDGSTYYDIATESYVDAQSIASLDDVGDVTITSAASGEFLKWNGSAWVNDSIPTINTLDDVGDVTITSAASGEFLKWNGSAWVNDSIPTINTLDDVGDVTITSAASGDFLKWNGSAWVNDPINLGTDTTGNYMVNVSAGDGINVSHTQGEGSTATISARDTLVRFYMEVI